MENRANYLISLIGPIRLRKYVMITSGIFLVCMVFGFSYNLGTSLGTPDTIKILQSPLKVAEIGDTIIVLDQESERKVIKKYTFDGFFLGMHTYTSEQGITGSGFKIQDRVTVTILVSS